MPWQCASLDDWRRVVADGERKHNRRYGLNEGIEAGWVWAGPTAEAKRRVEVARLMALITSIEKNGYQRSDEGDGDIEGNLLVDEKGRWVWQAMMGQHRAAVTSGFGLPTVPLRVQKVIRRADAPYWPNVVNQLFSASEALRVFDRVFMGDFQPVTDAWNRWISENK